MHVSPEPIEVTGPVGMARALVFDHRDPGQERPELSQRLCAIVDRLAVWREPAQQQVIDTGRFLGEQHLGAHLEQWWTATPEVALHAHMPQYAFRAHARDLRRTAAQRKHSADRA